LLLGDSDLWLWVWVYWINFGCTPNFPGTVDFGDVGVGQVASSNVTISNQSLAPVAIAQMSVSAQPFSVASTDKFPISIPPGGTHTVSIGFTPVSTSDYSADLTVMDLTAHPIAQVAMHGRGRAISI
jgi:Abnormal spindle-like microcephaly-assoc'd, ASPM-SPD-2-Hydin